MSVVSDLVGADDCNPVRSFNNSTVEGLAQISDELDSMYTSIQRSFVNDLTIQRNKLNQLYASIVNPLANQLQSSLQNLNDVYSGLTTDLNGRLETVASQGMNYQTIPTETLPTQPGMLPTGTFPSQQTTDQTSNVPSQPTFPTDDYYPLGDGNTSLLPNPEVSQSSQLASQVGNVGVAPLSNPDVIASPITSIAGVPLTNEQQQTTSSPLSLSPLQRQPQTQSTTSQQTQQTQESISQCCQSIAKAIEQLGLTQQQQQTINQYLIDIVQNQTGIRPDGKDTTTHKESKRKQPTEEEKAKCLEATTEENQDPYCTLQTYRDLYDAEVIAAEQNGLNLDLYSASFFDQNKVTDLKVNQLKATELMPKE